MQDSQPKVKPGGSTRKKLRLCLFAFSTFSICHYHIVSFNWYFYNSWLFKYLLLFEYYYHQLNLVDSIKRTSSRVVKKSHFSNPRWLMNIVEHCAINNLYLCYIWFHCQLGLICIINQIYSVVLDKSKRKHTMYLLLLLSYQKPPRKVFSFYPRP